jgi:hypothetical protein
MNSGSIQKNAGAGPKVMWWPLVFSFLMFFSMGCTQSKVAVSPEDQAAMAQAITTFLSKNSMGMQVKEIEKTSIQNDEAEVICKLTDADGLYAMGVTWKFWMQKQSGKWVALRYSDKF